MSNKTAYSYVRFSSAKQSSGDSLRRQTKAAEAYCLRAELQLDTSLSPLDLGISAHHGKNQSEGALGAFLSAVKTGKVAKGSTLVVESLDRLSRQEVPEALELFLSIIRAGIVIVTLSPEQRFEKATLNMTSLIISISQMSRAFEESALKSSRLKASWLSRRAKALKENRKV